MAKDEIRGTEVTQDYSQLRRKSPLPTARQGFFQRRGDFKPEASWARFYHSSDDATERLGVVPFLTCQRQTQRRAETISPITPLPGNAALDWPSRGTVTRSRSDPRYRS